MALVTHFSRVVQNYVNNGCTQWGQNVPKKAVSTKKKVAWHVDMVNILWIKRKNHLHFAMQMVKSVEVAGFEPAAFWSRTKRATKLRYTSKSEPTEGLEPSTCGLRNRCSTD